MSATETYVPRLKTRYQEQVAPALKEQLGLATVMHVPKRTKTVVNMSLGEAVQGSKPTEAAIRGLATIPGQRPRVNKARKSIASFKLREGMPIGVSVTLRGDRMWDFFDRLL